MGYIHQRAGWPEFKWDASSLSLLLAEVRNAQDRLLDITIWLKWFLECFARAIQGAGDLLEQVLRKARVWERINQGPVNARQRVVLNRLLDGFEGKLTSSKYAKLAKCSSDTALRDLQELLNSGILIQGSAGGRSTSYELIG